VLLAHDQAVQEHRHDVMAALTQGAQGAGRFFDVLATDSALEDTSLVVAAVTKRTLCTGRYWARTLYPTKRSVMAASLLRVA
jgi:hypothetical protein